MSDPLAAAKLKAETAYNAAANYYDAEPLGFWARYGRGPSSGYVCDAGRTYWMCAVVPAPLRCLQRGPSAPRAK
jgi:hypothetical protein